MKIARSLVDSEFLHVAAVEENPLAKGELVAEGLKLSIVPGDLEAV
jgi:hypothetical protein